MEDIIVYEKLVSMCEQLTNHLLKYNDLLVEQTGSIEITNEDLYTVASAYLTSHTEQIKVVKDEFKPLKKYIDDHKKIVLDYEKKLLTTLEQSKAILQQKMRSYYKKKEEEQKAMAEQMKERGYADIEPTKPSLTGASMRKSWYFEVMDKAKLPMEYLIPDEKSLNAYAREHKEKTNIPGGIAKYKLTPVS